MEQPGESGDDGDDGDDKATEAVTVHSTTRPSCSSMWRLTHKQEAEEYEESSGASETLVNDSLTPNPTSQPPSNPHTHERTISTMAEVGEGEPIQVVPPWPPGSFGHVAPTLTNLDLRLRDAERRIRELELGGRGRWEGVEEGRGRGRGGF
ncbi:hypothetical protein K402DRAFT_403484 [Aulographum hederae CBS 113979]|uniref:Uncharacterized protein n=1 Tax=Aulographum hederae CBS 113979 TaxID=1176131 RepID=A0A6G1H432_9PEZI|nr:hypothetical protein K402DRAFT_403484 [Aulographum hederae CBS 113979]